MSSALSAAVGAVLPAILPEPVCDLVAAVVPDGAAEAAINVTSAALAELLPEPAAKEPPRD